MHTAIPSGQQGRNSRPFRDIIPGQSHATHSSLPKTPPELFHRLSGLQALCLSHKLVCAKVTAGDADFMSAHCTDSLIHSRICSDCHVTAFQCAPYIRSLIVSESRPVYRNILPHRSDAVPIRTVHTGW